MRALLSFFRRNLSRRSLMWVLGGIMLGSFSVAVELEKARKLQNISAILWALGIFFVGVFLIHLFFSLELVKAQAL